MGNEQQNSQKQKLREPFKRFDKESINQIKVSEKIYRQAFAHRDQDTDRPLIQALESGVGYIEFDVYCIDEVILVAHDADDLNPERTIETQYLEPLKMICEKNGGYLYKEDPDFSITLFVDVKTETTKNENFFNDFKKAYRVLQKLVIDKYLDIVSHYIFETKEFVQKKVNLVITGHREKKDIKSLQPIRVATIDGRIDDLYNPDEYYDLIDYVSDNFENFFNKYKYVISSKLSNEDRQQVENWITCIRNDKKKFRLWATKDDESLWQDLLELGGYEIIINTDNPNKLVKYFRDKIYLEKK